MKEPKAQPEQPEQEQDMEPRLTTKRPKGQPALGRDIQAKIGQQLRAYYDSLVEPPSDRFAELLKQLEKPASKDPSE
jgi:hypothetical protein